MIAFTSISWILMLLMVLLSVAFFTLFERKVMGLVHFRLGPNKVLFLGLIQPLLDAFKLLSKSYSIPSSSNLVPYYMSPYLSLGISLFLWLTMPLYYTSYSVSFSFLVFMCVTSLMVFPLLISGWSSNSKYSFMGCLRAIAQSISYEAVFSTLIILLMCVSMTFSLKSLSSLNILGFLILMPMWVFCVLAESHRAPFDFSESESELVSGFNTEYMGSLFAFIFLSEYSTLLLSCFFMSWLFLSPLMISALLSVITSLIFSLIIIYIRVTYCRFRYDLLMMAAWKSYLPVVLSFLILYLTFMSSSSLIIMK